MFVLRVSKPRKNVRVHGDNLTKNCKDLMKTVKHRKKKMLAHLVTQYATLYFKNKQYNTFHFGSTTKDTKFRKTNYTTNRTAFVPNPQKIIC